MAVVIKRNVLTTEDKDYIRTTLTLSSNTDPPTIIKPFIVVRDEADPLGGTVRLPFAFYRELRAYGKHWDWPEFPNDVQHANRFATTWEFNGALRDYQEEVWVELLTILKGRRSVLLGAYCGFGKTMMTVFLSAKCQLPTLVIYHIGPLGRSWPSSFEGASNAIVCHLGKEPYNPFANVYICTVGFAGSDKFPADLIPRIGMLVIDEAHCYCTTIRANIMLRFSPKYFINLTATPIKGNGLGVMLCLFHGRVNEGDKVGCEVIRMSPRTFTVYKQATSLKPRIIPNARGLDWQEVKNSMLTKPELIAMIVEWVMLNPHKKILVYVVQRNQLDAVVEGLKAAGEKSVVGFYGKAMTYEDSRVLVGIDKKVGLGFDEASTATNYDGKRINMIVLGWTIKDPSSLDQVVGRMRVDAGSVVDFVHDFSSFSKHWEIRKEWYEGRKASVKVVQGPTVLME